MDDFIHNDLHVVLRIGVDLIDEEVGCLTGNQRFMESWKEFAATVRGIQEKTSKSIVGELKTKFEIAHTELLRADR
jgi:hypothetical protein